MATVAERIATLEAQVVGIGDRLTRMDTRLGTELASLHAEITNHHHSNGSSKKSMAGMSVGGGGVVVAIIEGLRMLFGG